MENQSYLFLFIILSSIIFSLFTYLISEYNKLISKKNQIENVLSSLGVVLKRRYDLIPNLIASVKAYMQYESELLTKITNLRISGLNQNIPVEEKFQIENQISNSLGKLLVSVENYPDLKTNQNFLQLQEAITEIEEELSASRRAYNGAITAYNNALEMFPSNMIASLMNLTYKNWFEIEEKEKENIDVAKEFNIQ